MDINEIGTISDESLKNTDFIIAVDTSGSMDAPSSVPSLKGKSRFDEVMEEAKGVCYAAGRFDTDGITLIFFGNNKVVVHDGVTSDNVEAIFAKTIVGGTTPTHLAIDAIHKKSKESTKEVVAFVYTDGIPDDEAAVKAAIISAAKDLGDTKTGILFNQVGNDAGAKTFLQTLDSGLGDDVPDIVATLTVDAAAGLKIGQKAWLARNA